MAVARPSVNIYNEKSEPVGTVITMPGVFKAPIRPDIVNSVHDRMRKNSRQSNAVYRYAGHETSAESWGTGRAVARIPRVHGGGTNRSGQGAFGNMCRGGHMCHPKKVFRRWHRKINISERRVALCSAIAASGIPALVMARGHNLGRVPEIPLVLSSDVEGIKKTKQAVTWLKNLKAYSDIQKVKNSRHLRPGIGKMRNRRYIKKRGPIIIYDSDKGLTKAFRNIEGITLINVKALNLLKFAPGGHVGRFAIWTENAFRKLDAIYGTPTKPSTEKHNFDLPRSKMTNTDLQSLLQSSEIQAAVRRHRMKDQKPAPRVKKNPLKNAALMSRLNPFAISLKRRAIRENRKNLLAKKRKASGEVDASAPPAKKGKLGAVKGATTGQASGKGKPGKKPKEGKVAAAPAAVKGAAQQSQTGIGKPKTK